MKFLVCLAALIACGYAKEFFSPVDADQHPGYFTPRRVSRHPRDITWDKPVGDNGKIFGTLGGNDDGLFGKAGYNHEIFNDDRGKMNAQAYGSRVLGPYGDSTNFGGKLDWADKNARAAIDLSRPNGGHTGLTATGEGLWNLDKNTQVSAGGFYSQPFLGHGKSDYGLKAGITRYF